MSSAAAAPPPSPEPRPVLFLSHAGADTEAARKLAERIEATPEARAAELQVWLDKRDLVPGRGWQEQLERAITEQSTAFAVYVGASGVVNWVDSEVRLALSRARKDESYHFIPIISAKASGSGALPPFAGQYHGVRNVETDDAEFAKLIRVLLNREPRTPIQLVDRPFPGLVPFDEAKSHLFFGREAETEELVERLRRNPLLMVVGDSGSGKSSLVRAGLVPRFRGGALADHSGDRPDESIWHAVIARPRGQPFEALADAVAEAGRKIGIDAATLGTVKDWIRTKRPEKVRDAMLHGAPSGAKILLVIDQFEELLTQTKEPLRRPFVDALLNLVADSVDTTIRVVLTMRQDYYNLSSGYTELYARLEADNGAAKYPIPRMKEEGLRACVREPLKLAGVNDTGVLEDEIVRDVGEDRASQLALVQMALSEAWRVRKDFNDDLLSAYVSRGRVAGALANAANEVYEQQLSPEERALTEALFIRLVQLGDTGGMTRRIANRDEFSDETWKLAQKLGDEDHRRLLVIRGEKDAATAELSHEALVTQWPPYQSWLQASPDLKRTHDRVIRKAKAWYASGRPDNDLATGSELDDGVKLLVAKPEWLSITERDFLRSSRTAARTRTRRARLAVAALVLLTAAASVFGWYAYDRGRMAENQRAVAEGQRQIAETAMLDMVRALWGWGGFMVGSGTFEHRLGSGAEGVILQASGLDLHALLELVVLDGVEASGTISGALPIHVEDGVVIVKDGEFRADRPGWLRYRPQETPAALAGGGEGADLMLQALENFRYETLRITLDGRTDGEMDVGLHVNGANPNLYGGYPVEFNLNLNLESNLLAMTEGKLRFMVTYLSQAGHLDQD